MLTEAGYGEAFIHRTGHGLGLSLHEEPYLVEGNTLPLEEGMVFSDEPGVYFPGQFGIRIEDTVVCTAAGGRRLNEATRTLEGDGVMGVRVDRGVGIVSRAHAP